MEPHAASRVTLKNVVLAIAVVLVTQSVALLMTRVNQPVLAQTGYSYAPAGTSSAGSAGNALILVALVFGTTMLALFLVRHRKASIFRFFIFAGTMLALFVLTLLTGDIAFSYLVDEPTAILLALLVAAGAGLLLTLTTFTARFASLRGVVTVLLSAEVGSYLASTIPFLTALMIPAVFSIYDIYAVFKGPLKHLISLSPENIGPISTQVGEFSLGVGDTVFYSMLPSVVLFRFGPSCALLTLIAVNAGVIVTLYSLSRSHLLPGLPIPMGLGLAALLLCTGFF